jgi:CRISPR-associated protein Csm2
MTNGEAVQFRSQIEQLETSLKNERDKERRKVLEKQIDRKFKEVLGEFNNNIELNSVENIDEQSILYSEFLGRYLVFLDLSTSQIRNVYGEVMRLKMKGFNANELVLLKPRLAYSTERKGTDGSRKFREVIEKALDKVIFTKEKQEELFQNFANFFEAILAYHRSFGGK